MGLLTHGKSLCNNGCHSGEGFHINSDRKIACFWSKASAKKEREINMYGYNLVYIQVLLHVCMLKCAGEGGKEGGINRPKVMQPKTYCTFLA
jgi:hypothetical protein